jgi:hypothetical protein
MGRLKRSFLFALIVCTCSASAARDREGYLGYHRAVTRAEELITQKKYSAALAVFDSTFSRYDFIFLRDYKVAAQLAWHLGEQQKAFAFVRSAIACGWTLKEIGQNRFLAPLRSKQEWQLIRSDYDSLHAVYKKKLNLPLRTEVREMFKKDQRLALGNLFRIGRKARERFLNRKFVPQSERQLLRLREIMNEYGYPGEKLIGNWQWMWTILSHHNSISMEYVQKDTLYPSLKPGLLEAIRRGELSPYDYAVIEDWYVTVKSARKEAAFGYLNTLRKEDLPRSNRLRQDIGMRTIETRNGLVDIQEQTGMDFYLAGALWKIRKIVVADTPE